MACACNKNAKSGKATYTHTAPSGATTSYSSQTEAEAAKLRLGGTVKKS